MTKFLDKDNWCCNYTNLLIKKIPLIFLEKSFVY